MAKFDVYRMPGTTDLLLDIQNDLLSGLNTRACVPLLLEVDGLKSIDRLTPILVIGDNRYVMMTHFVTSVPLKALREKLTNVGSEQYRISAAFDMLLHGF